MLEKQKEDEVLIGEEVKDTFEVEKEEIEVVSREEMVDNLGEEAVAKIESEAIEYKNELNDSIKKQYQGKEIITEGNREVNGKVFINIRLIDGSTHDLTSEEYSLQVTNSVV